MSIVLPSLPVPGYPRGRRESLDTAQPSTPARNVLREPPVAAPKVPATGDIRRAAERVVDERHRTPAYAGVPEGLGRRAVASYDAVARHNDVEYVRTVLGIDEFA